MPSVQPSVTLLCAPFHRIAAGLPVRTSPARSAGRAPEAAAIIAAVLLAAVAPAQDRDASGRALDRPPPIDSAPRDVTGEDLVASMRSDVRVVARENHEIEEHRVGNNVYMIKVKPKNAPPYYLYDNDGSGDFAWRRGTELERTQVPQWAIMRW